MERPAPAEAGTMLGFPLVVANITGNPAMSVLFRLAAQLEEACPWHDRWPPVR